VAARFSAPVQTGPESHPASYTMVTGSFLGLKRPGRGVDQTPPSSPMVKERVGLYLCSLSGSSWPLLGRALPLPLPERKVPRFLRKLPLLNKLYVQIPQVEFHQTRTVNTERTHIN